MRLSIDGRRLHRPSGISESQRRVAKENITFLLLRAEGFSHTVDVTKPIILATNDAEQIVVDANVEIKIVAAVCHPRCGEHGHHAAILVKESIFAQRSALVAELDAIYV